MNEEDIKAIYKRCRAIWDIESKPRAINEAMIDKYCTFADAITRVLIVNSLSIEGTVYNPETGCVLFGLLDANGSMAGTLSVGEKGIDIAYVKRRDNQEAYSDINYNGEFTSGTISTINDKQTIYSATLAKDNYTIGEESYRYESETEGDKIMEAIGTLAIRSQAQQV